MARQDIISRWREQLSFAVISTARRLRVSNEDIRQPSAGDAEWSLYDYIEVDNRGNKGALIYWALNGRTASSVLATAVTGTTRDSRPQFRTYYDSIDRVFARASSISAIAAGNATTIFVTVGRF